MKKVSFTYDSLLTDQGKILVNMYTNQGDTCYCICNNQDTYHQRMLKHTIIHSPIKEMNILYTKIDYWKIVSFVNFDIFYDVNDVVVNEVNSLTKTKAYLL